MRCRYCCCCCCVSFILGTFPVLSCCCCVSFILETSSIQLLSALRRTYVVIVFCGFVIVAKQQKSDADRSRRKRKTTRRQQTEQRQRGERCHRRWSPRSTGVLHLEPAAAAGARGCGCVSMCTATGTARYATAPLPAPLLAALVAAAALAAALPVAAATAAAERGKEPPTAGTSRSGASTARTSPVRKSKQTQAKASKSKQTAHVATGLQKQLPYYSRGCFGFYFRNPWWMGLRSFIPGMFFVTALSLLVLFPELCVTA